MTRPSGLVVVFAETAIGRASRREFDHEHVRWRPVAGNRYESTRPVQRAPLFSSSDTNERVTSNLHITHKRYSPLDPLVESQLF